MGKETEGFISKLLNVFLSTYFLALAWLCDFAITNDLQAI